MDNETVATEQNRNRKASAAQSHSLGGYALFLGVGNGDLMEQVALRSELHIVGTDPDKAKIDALRRRFDAAGL